MKALLLSILLVSSMNAIAVEGKDTETSASQSNLVAAGNELKNIHKGDWEMGGSLGLGYSSFSGTVVNAQPRVQYFVLDRFSVGATLDFAHSDTYQRIGGGPALSYYFWESGQWASYLGQNVVWTQDKVSGVTDTDLQGTTSLGLNYFVTPAVAMGMNFNHTYELDDDAFDGEYSVLRGTFLIYF